VSKDMPATKRASFYTVAETAALLRVDAATIYRAIREDAFPAIRVRSRYVVPAARSPGWPREAGDDRAAALRATGRRAG
jgi:excisionase family DNA binding protein